MRVSMIKISCKKFSKDTNILIKKLSIINDADKKI